MVILNNVVIKEDFVNVFIFWFCDFKKIVNVVLVCDNMVVLRIGNNGL